MKRSLQPGSPRGWLSASRRSIGDLASGSCRSSSSLHTPRVPHEVPDPEEGHVGGVVERRLERLGGGSPTSTPSTRSRAPPDLVVDEDRSAGPSPVFLGGGDVILARIRRPIARDAAVAESGRGEEQRVTKERGGHPMPVPAAGVPSDEPRRKARADPGGPNQPNRDATKRMHCCVEPGGDTGAAP